MDEISEAMLSLDGLDDLSPVETLQHAAEIQRNVNLAESELLKVAAHWADLNATLANPDAATLPGTERLVRLGGLGTPVMAEFASADLAAQLGVSAHAGAAVIADALDLRHRLPQLWDLVRDGRVKVYIGRFVAKLTRPLTQADAALVDEALAPYATTLGWARLEPILIAQITKVDPELAETLTSATRDSQGVFIGRGSEHGYKTAFIRAAGPDVEAFDAGIDEIASALDLLGDPDTLDVRRAKAVGIIASTQATLEVLSLAAAREQEAEIESHGEPVKAAPRERTKSIGTAVMYVHLSQQAVLGGGAAGIARIEDLGPALREQVQEWLGHRKVIVKPVIDLNDTPALDGYEVPGWLEEAMDLRTIADCFPYATNTKTHGTGRGDDDHTEKYRRPTRGGPPPPPKQTRLPNLGRLTRFHHRIKTHGKWKVIQLISGVWLWHSPHGFSYLVDHTGTTQLGRMFATTD